MERFIEAARANLAYLGDTGVDPEDAQAVLEEVWTLAYDGAIEAGATSDEATEAAQLVSEFFG